MEKNELLKLIEEGKTFKEIGAIFNMEPRTVGYWVNKYRLNNNLKYRKTVPFNLNKIDSKELAYIIGFIAADANIDNKECVEISVGINDIEIVQFISKVLDCNIKIDNTTNSETRRFPRARTSKQLNNITMLFGGRLKANRNLPVISNNLVKYLILGFFDGDGCITWGVRKDRNRLWHKISFTSSLSLLTSIQKILLKHLQISTIIRPKTNENCFILEFNNINDIIKFTNWIYDDKSFIILKRKFNNTKALRLKLGEFGETTSNSTIPSRAVDHSTEGVETTGGKMDFLNNQQENPRQLKLFDC